MHFPSSHKNKPRSIFWQYRYVFIAAFLIVFSASFVVLSLIGLLPEELADPEVKSLVTIVNAEADKVNDGVTVIRNNLEIKGEEPVKIVIAKIGVNSSVHNPNTTNVAALDEELKKGVVRYPGSGLLGKGNVFLFGHSSTLRVINNPAYKALNHLDRLVVGDEIKVYSGGKEYLYRVSTVEKKNESQAIINLADTTNKLTISTCDSFSGIKQQRIIVEADFVGSRPL
jgi:LPXTG-site transpeptidase (sortase) family protein